MRLPKDPFPALSHWFGAALSLAALVLLLRQSLGRPWWEVTACAVYGVTLVQLYSASALAHSFDLPPRAQERLDRLDYAAIFLLIAGTYTPVCVVALRGPWGWALLAAIWATAAVGIATLFHLSSGRRSRVITYVTMGWLGLVGAVPLLHVLPAPAIAWILAGGVVYTLGSVVYFTDRPHLWPGRFMAHDLWHCMVIAGSACQFLGILNYIVPRRLTPPAS